MRESRSDSHLWQTSSSPATCGSGFPPAPRPGLREKPPIPQTAQPGSGEDHGAPPGTANWRTMCQTLRPRNTHTFTESACEEPFEIKEDIKIS